MQLTADKTPALYYIAVHHVASFLFQDVGSSSSKERARSAWAGDEESTGQRRHTITRAVLALGDTVYRHVIFYQTEEPATKFELPSGALKITEHRRQVLVDAASTDDAVQAALRKRHPSLFQ